MIAIWAILRRVPIWAWVLLAALAWGGFQRHQARTVERKHALAAATAAAEREARMQADAAETSRRLNAQQEITDDARKQAKALAADVERARAAEQRLRARLTSIQADAGASHPAASSGSPTASEAGAVLADMLGRCGARVRELAEYADAARTAGETCERAYTSLIPAN